MPAAGELREKLVLSVVDKLVFGLLIVFAGFVLNWVLENHRADQAMKTEIARVRVARVAEVWSALDRQDRAIQAYGDAFFQQLFDVVYNQLEPGYLESEQRVVDSTRKLERTTDKMRVAQRSTLTLLQGSRFWIGERLYPQYLRYAHRQRALVTLFRSYLTLFEKGDEAGLDALETKLQHETRDLRAARVDVFSVMQRMS